MATEAFCVGFEDASACSLQDAFLKYKGKKQDELRRRTLEEHSARLQRADPTSMAALRNTFLQTALSYLGVPYAQKYHEPGSEAYNSELFLDCCGLVRWVLKDLKEEFGFTTGPWNQAYQFDTLPLALSGPEDMKPGDLVFISGVYHNTKARKQKHGMVHVEIWLGDGEKTVGARWQKGRVQIHDSYRFEAKAYHSMQYHFKSIDTWLQGVCKSFCPDHPWKLRKFEPGKHSIFSLQQQSQYEEQCSAYSEVSLETGSSTLQNEVDKDGCSKQDEDDDTPPEGTSALRSQDKTTEGSISQSRNEATATQSSIDGKSQDIDGSARASPLSKKKKKRPSSSAKRPSSSSPAKAHRKPLAEVKTTRTARAARSFITQGGNAAPLVEKALLQKGWLQLEDRSSFSFTLKWVEIKNHIDFKNFRAGEQMVNHFPNINLLTTKIGLLESLRGYSKIHRPHLRMDSFVPQTYRMDVPNEKEEFLRNYKEADLWICKPTGANQGKGIFLVRELQQLLDRLESDQKQCKPTTRPTPRIVQKYISNPLLLDGRKFDIRVYLLIIAASPYVVLFRDGYIRLCCDPYEPSSTDLCVHLTNQYQQRKHPLYSEVKEDTIWDFAKFQEHLCSSDHQLPEDWVATTLTSRMRSIVVMCFNSVRHKLQQSVGCFDLLGVDFMIDTNLNVWLIEMNINPALHTNCDTLSAISPLVIEETLELAIEVFDKCRRNKPLLPLTSARSFVPIATS